MVEGGQFCWCCSQSSVSNNMLLLQFSQPSRSAQVSVSRPPIAFYFSSNFCCSATSINNLKLGYGHFTTSIFNARFVGFKFSQSTTPSIPFLYSKFRFSTFSLTHNLTHCQLPMCKLLPPQLPLVFRLFLVFFFVTLNYVAFLNHIFLIKFKDLLTC